MKDYRCDKRLPSIRSKESYRLDFVNSFNCVWFSDFLWCLWWPPCSSVISFNRAETSSIRSILTVVTLSRVHAANYAYRRKYRTIFFSAFLYRIDLFLTRKRLQYSIIFRGWRWSDILMMMTKWWSVWRNPRDRILVRCASHFISICQPVLRVQVEMMEQIFCSSFWSVVPFV